MSCYLYRPSASTLLIYHDRNKTTANSGCDFEILMAMRSPKTAFASHHYVFPGGNFETRADAAHEWLSYFEEFSVHETELRKFHRQHLPHRPALLMRAKDNEISRDISLRITAIRETFEEVGVLLCINQKQYKQRLKGTNNTNTFTAGKEMIWPNLKLKKKWQNRIHRSASAFLELCRQYKLIPDLWALNEWNVWRSPSFAQKKYDAAFYMVVMQTKPHLLLEKTEISNALWLTPSQSLKLFQSCAIWLATPQFYEISYLANINSLANLLKIISKKRSEGFQLFQPVPYLCSNESVVITLPGDDHHSVDDTSDGPIKVSYSDKEFAQRARNLHRITYRDIHDAFVTGNLDSSHCSTTILRPAVHCKL